MHGHSGHVSGDATEMVRPSKHARRGVYKGSEVLRLAVLKYAAVLGAPYIDVEYLASEFFFSSESHTLPFIEVMFSWKRHHHDLHQHEF